MASRLLSTFESAGLAATATFASVLWIGLALPGLPLLPGVGGGQNSNVAISLSSAVLGVQDSRTFAASVGTAGRQARLLSLLLPTPDPLGKDLATKQPDTEAQSSGSMVVALPPAPPAPDLGPRVIESTQLASAASAPAPSPPAPPPPRPPVSSPPPPRQPDPKPQPAPPTLPIDPPPPATPDVPPVAGDTPPSDGSSADTTTTPDADSAPADGNGNGNGNADGNNPNAGGANAGGNGNGNAGGDNPNAGGDNPNAGGANAGGNGNGNGAQKGLAKGQ